MVYGAVADSDRLRALMAVQVCEFHLRENLLAFVNKICYENFDWDMEQTHHGWYTLSVKNRRDSCLSICRR